ncbi:MAG: acetoin dehydrogenase [Herbiconiux sp.]|uniref:alpha-ketoacid dehydrogenase subunit beta n=1 Tax=Herbiconiux sp. TaxID=1871186 RepID=UPI00121023B0|nr:transketolase C-terminal domain-containing protein [Herbiconiux sp.]TAJ46921.1 MAG: acetoin dehydrogenase [Herbiconiux sp.]
MPDQIARLTYAQAANAALRRALDELPKTLLFGEDVAIPGGVFGVTKGLRKEFGDRVFDTPISESAILGGAVGTALMGLRPIVEIMWVDFSLVALDQIINQAANVRYLSRGSVSAPITIRTQQGTMPGACAQHSQSLEALFSHIPGLQVCMPGNAQDAYDLLWTAINTDDPCLVIENRTLYHGERTEVSVGGPALPVGASRLVRPGRDLTIVSWGATVHQCEQAAEDLLAHGVDAEIIDLRWLRPLDTATVLESVARTGRLLVAHEAHRFAGMGAEVVATVAESGVHLSAAPVRVAMPDARIPAAPTLLAALVPNAQWISSAAERLVAV